MPNVSKPNRKQLTPEEKTEIEEAFDLFDSDRDKLLDRDEFKVALKARLLSYCYHKINDCYSAARLSDGLKTASNGNHKMIIVKTHPTLRTKM